MCSLQIMQGWCYFISARLETKINKPEYCVLVDHQAGEREGYALGHWAKAFSWLVIMFRWLSGVCITNVSS